MPNCDFYAAGADHKAVLEFVLSQGDSDIYELCSRFDKPLRQFRSLADFEEHFSIVDWAAGAADTIYLQLYPHGAGGSFYSRRIELNPKRCAGATFRYEAQGWGLVQLYLEPPREGRLCESHTNHNSPKRAAAWSNTIRDLGDPSAWDWQRVSSFSRRLNRFIHSIAVAKAGSRVILPYAAELQKQGVQI
jgi:hypothetical protein